jgi:hypothetical protein
MSDQAIVTPLKANQLTTEADRQSPRDNCAKGVVLFDQTTASRVGHSTKFHPASPINQADEVCQDFRIWIESSTFIFIFYDWMKI